ncbi:MAG: chemotaxis protein CheW, partial [Campylobacterota bacterium]|nr:chemotaxis protein CheW [Campylobacterota bacterium]
MSEKLQNIINKQQDQSNPAVTNIDDVVQLVGFVVGDEEYSVPILTIQEIIKPIAWTRVPQTPAYVLGVFNLRGSVIPLIDLRAKFGLGSINHTDDTRFIVIRHEDEVAGFVIDRLTEAIRLSKSSIGPAPETALDSESIIEG